MSGTDLLAQLRQLLAIEQAARMVAPSGGFGLFTSGDAGMGAIPDPNPVQADAMVLDLLEGAGEEELLAARQEAGTVGDSQEATWLADEIKRRGLGGPA